MLAEIILNIPVNKTFEYKIPTSLEKSINCYTRVKVNFRNKIELGIISKIYEQQERPYELKEIITLYDESPIISEKEIELARWISKRYFTSIGEALFLFIPKGLREQKKQEHINKSNELIHANDLNEEQESVFKQIKLEWEKIKRKEQSTNNFLIYGVTGSGKTEIYFQIIKQMIQDGKQVVLLLPEIALTPQMMDFFKEKLGEEIALIHSKISNSKKLTLYKKIMRGEINIIIGPRSALFVPAFNLGCIIVDEEHDDSYKSAKKPRYDARFVAIKRASLYGALCIFGSATPSIESWYSASKGELKLLRLEKRFNNLPLPTVELVNLTSAEKYQDFYISMRIIEAISERLERKQKVIIFLNRRGFNSFIQCRDCGLVLYCDSCSIPLTYHNASQKLQCHYCGIEKEMVTECPDCHSKNLKYLGLGTEKVEQIIQNYFQNYKIARFDADSVKESNYDEILNNFKNGDTDILIGTQMITKGHHFPDVNLVCVINADILLNMPDFRANEKTFQTLVQVSGRAGRTYERGHVLIQTLRPTHYAIECVVNQDYESFIDKELKVRKSLNYPPFVRMLRILIKGKEEQRAMVASKKLLFSIQQFILQMNLKGKVIILGPSKAPIEKIEASYRYHIILKSHNLSVLIDIGNYLNDNFKLDSHLNIEFDIDPVSLL